MKTTDNLALEWTSDQFCFVRLSDAVAKSLAAKLDLVGAGRQTDCEFTGAFGSLKFAVEDDQFRVSASRDLIDVHADQQVLLNIANSIKSYFFYKAAEDGEPNMLDISLEMYGAEFSPGAVKEVVLGNNWEPCR